MASKKKRGKPSRATKKAKPARSTRSATRSKSKGGARKAAARKRTSVTVAQAKSRKAAEVRKKPQILDEVIEEPLLDVSMILRVKDGVARSLRDVDEDELKSFPDPSLVVDAQAGTMRRDEDEDADESGTRLPELFAAEARRQKERDED
jgi:hypothetical protein